MEANLRKKRAVNSLYQAKQWWVLFKEEVCWCNSKGDDASLQRVPGWERLVCAEIQVKENTENIKWIVRYILFYMWGTQNETNRTRKFLLGSDCEKHWLSNNGLQEFSKILCSALEKRIADLNIDLFFYYLRLIQINKEDLVENKNAD